MTTTVLHQPIEVTAIASQKGVDVHAMMAEIYGKQTGACCGKGGSMHIADLSKGMMGANGILGAGSPWFAAQPWPLNNSDILV
ncbi:thiamine pyrophosphate-dependent enzyme [Enterovibrio sp. Hal110]